MKNHNKLMLQDKKYNRRKHQRYALDWICHVENASFELQEAKRNDGCCPWCGDLICIEDE